MKTKLSYDEVFKFSVEMAEDIKLKMPDVQEIIAVSRGGLTIAHIIAKHLRLPVGVYIPKMKLLVSEFKNIVIVEDLVAHGRTYEGLEWVMKHHYPSKKWMFAPFLVDAQFYQQHNIVFPITHIVPKDWIVFPWEDFDKMKEGDRGLFREGSDKYGK